MASSRMFQMVLPAIFTAFRRLRLWGFARRCLLVSSFDCHAAFIPIPTPGPAQNGRSERGASSAAVESMTAAMSVATSLMQVPSGIGGHATTIVFATWYRRFGPAINHLRSAVSGVSLALSLFVRFVALMRTCVGCGLWRTRDCKPILVPPKRVGGH